MYLHDQVIILLHLWKTPADLPAYTCFPGIFELSLCIQIVCIMYLEAIKQKQNTT